MKTPFFHNSDKTLLWAIITAIFIILADVFDWCSSLLDMLGTVGSGAIALLSFCAVILYAKPWKWFRLPVVTEFDTAMITGIETAIMLVVYTLFLYIAGDPQFHFYKVILLTGTLLLLALSILLRRRTLTEAHEEKKYNTFTLEELYQGKIPEKNEIIYMEEDAVDYDLLNRGELIHTISNVIRTCQPRRKYVISLTGAWGQGKTTIINNVKRELALEKDIVIIDSFDPWNYESKEALFSGMMDAIFRYAEVHYDINRIRSWKRQLGELIFDLNAYTKGLKTLVNKDQETVQELKALMNDFLGRYKRKIVFVLDNIERMDDENILLLFKLVADVLDLDHIIYILSYDAERIRTVLDKAGLKDRYLKKVIQMEFYVPPIDTGRKREIFFVSLKNLLKIYNVEEEKQEELLHLSSSFMERIGDVRDMKRFFNSIISPCYGIQNRWIRKLNAKDYVIMELLKRDNPLLYNEIAGTPNFFVSADRDDLFGQELHLGDWKNKFNEEAKLYFDNLFSGPASGRNKEWLDLLAEIFPFVENYRDYGNVIEIGHFSYGRDTYKNTIQKTRIYSGKFFTQYFTLQSNDYMDIKLKVEEVLRLANCGLEKESQENFRILCREYPGWEQAEIVEMLQLFLEDLSQKGWDILFPILYEESADMNDTLRFFGFSARKRTYYLLSLGLDKISEELFNRSLVGIQGQYENIRTLEQIIYHKRLNPKAEEEEPRFEGRALLVYETLKQMVERADREGINLYSDRYYRELNIWGWYHIIKFIPEKDVKEAFSPMLGEQSIYRFLWDMTRKSVGAGYGYTLEESNFNIFTDRQTISSILEARMPRTDSEAFVRKVWDAYVEFEGDSSQSYHEAEVGMEYPVELML